MSVLNFNLEYVFIAFVSHIPEVLKVLFEILNKEKNLRVIDNVCAAVCRMITAGLHSVPLDVVSRWDTAGRIVAYF